MKFRRRRYLIVFFAIFSFALTYFVYPQTFKAETICQGSICRTQLPLSVAKKTIWTEAVSVCWETPDFNTEKGWVRSSIANTWENVSAIRFTGWQACQSTSNGIRIRIADEGPHTKGLGRELAGMASGMVLNFTFNNWSNSCSASSNRESCIRSIGVHEFGHAMGFAHEQNRGDTPETCTEPKQGSNGDTNVGIWDLSSVMNYCNPNWNNAGKLSATDIEGAVNFYGSPSTFVSVAVFNGRLVAVAKGIGSDERIYITQTDQNWKWNGKWTEIPGNGRTSTPPAITVFNNKLVVLIRGSGDDGQIYITQTDENWNWNLGWNVVPGNGRTSYSPAVTVFNNRLVVLVKGQFDDNQIYITQTDANWNWNPVWNLVPGNGRTNSSPAVTVFNNRLVTLIRGSGNDGQIYITQTDANWNWNSGWNTVPGNGRTNSSPAVTVFNNRLVTLIRGSGDDNQIYITQTDANWNWNSGWTKVASSQ